MDLPQRLTLSTKAKVGITAIALAGSFAAGRFSVRSPEVKTEIQTAKQETNITDKKEDVKTHTETKIVEVKTPDGTDTKTTTIAQVQDQDTDIKKDDKVSEKTDEKQDIIPPKANTLQVSALVGTSLTNLGQPTYGLAASKQVIGPFSVGVWGFTDSRFGISISISF